MEIEGLRQEVRRAARGDEDAAALLFDAYYPRVYRYALARVRNQQDAEDVAAETFAKVLRSLDRFKWKGGGFEAWVFRIASNVVVDMFRSSVRERPDEQIDEDLPGAPDSEPETLVLRGESVEQLGRVLAQLPDDQREVITLRFAAGLDTHETARAMKRKTNAVRQLQFRALENLRKRMTP